MSGWSFDSGIGMGWIGVIVLLLVLGGIIIGGIFSIKWLVKNPGMDRFQAQELDALKILKTRYAKGEISREEFLVIKSDLGHLQN